MLHGKCRRGADAPKRNAGTAAPPRRVCGAATSEADNRGETTHTYSPCWGPLCWLSPNTNQSGRTVRDGLDNEDSGALRPARDPPNHLDTSRLGQRSKRSGGTNPDCSLSSNSAVSGLDYRRARSPRETETPPPSDG